jgi:hypothetical protein
MNGAALSRAHVLSRIAASLLGSYVFVWGFGSLGTLLGVAAGMPYAEAQALVFLVTFLVMLGCFCWAFTAASLTRVWAVLAGGGALMTGASWLLGRALS